MLTQVGHHDDPVDAPDARPNLARARQRVDLLAGVAIPVGAEEHAWPNLAEAVEHAVGAEVRRAGRPDGADGCRREHGHDRFGEVRQKSRDPVAHTNTVCTERSRRSGDLSVELAEGEAALRTVLVPEDDSGTAIVVPQQVLGEVEARAGEPAWPSHGIGRPHAVQTDDHIIPRAVSRALVRDDVAISHTSGQKASGCSMDQR